MSFEVPYYVDVRYNVVGDFRMSAMCYGGLLTKTMLPLTMNMPIFGM